MPSSPVSEILFEMLDPEGEDTMTVIYVRYYSLNNVMSHPRRHKSSATLRENINLTPSYLLSLVHFVISIYLFTYFFTINNLCTSRVYTVKLKV